MAALRTSSALLTSTLLLALCASPASAQQQGFDDGWTPDDDYRAYSKEFNGTFTDLSARLGLGRARRSSYGSRSLDVGARIAFPAYVGDFRLSYRLDQLSHDESEPDITLHSSGLALAFHPAYLLILGSDWLSYLVASFYLDLGVGAQLGVLRGEELERDPGLYVHGGAGFDVPLWDPDVGQALWLNFAYRYHHGDFDTNAGPSIKINNHSAFVGLSWRINRLIF